MNRRGFLALLSAAGMVPSELWKPSRTIFLPPVGGWASADINFSSLELTLALDNLFTPELIARESLRILHQNYSFVGSVNRGFDDSFAFPRAVAQSSIRVRVPSRYQVTA